MLLIDLAIIIAAARAFGALARRCGQPAVIGEVVAGIVLGPTVLGRLFPNVPPALFPPEVPLRQLADLGLVFFVFLIGLELDPQLIRKEGRRALAISLSGLALPFVLGALIGIPLLTLNNAGAFRGGAAPPTTVTFSLFMGAAMCVTAFPVLARILVERGLHRAPIGTATLCAAAVDDVAAWVLLAAVVGIARTGSIAAAGIPLALTGLFAAVMVLAGRPLLARLAHRSEATGRLTVDQVAVVVVGLFLSAYFTERIGIHAIFGAFTFGACMPHTSRMTRELTDKLEDVTVIVLLPAFFAVAGLQTNLLTLNSPELLLWTLLVVVMATLGKLVGCGAAARLSGYSTRDSLALGTLMNTRGLAELVILSVGLGLGVLSDRTYAMMVVMALATTFIAAPIMNRIMPRREMVRLLAGGDPAPEIRRVLVAIGNPDNARALVGAGILLTGSARPAELLLVRLIPTPRAPEFRTGLKDEESQIDRSVEAMNRLRHDAEHAGVSARGISFLSDDVGQDLAHIAAAQHCDAVLLGWHRASLDRRVIRALVHRVFSLASCDVVVFIDRRGDGIQPRADRPIVLASTSHGEAAVIRTVTRLAESLTSGVETVPLRAQAGDRVRPGSAEGPGLVDEVALEAVARKSAGAIVAVISTGPVWSDEHDFGQPATTFAAVSDCPVLVVRPGLAAPVMERNAVSV
jgi:Kef-type K+ transport system membrane component KefB